MELELYHIAIIVSSHTSRQSLACYELPGCMANGLSSMGARTTTGKIISPGLSMPFLVWELNLCITSVHHTDDKYIISDYTSAETLGSNSFNVDSILLLYYVNFLNRVIKYVHV